MKPSLIFRLIILTLASSASGKPPYPFELPDAEEMAYKTVGKTKLKLWIFEPEGQGHSFFNRGRHGNYSFRKTMPVPDQFLSRLSWIKGKPSIDAFMKKQSR